MNDIKEKLVRKEVKRFLLRRVSQRALCGSTQKIAASSSIDAAKKKVNFDPIAIKKSGYMFVYLNYETRTIHHEDVPSYLRLVAR
jgi:hypothetical protein